MSFRITDTKKFIKKANLIHNKIYKYNKVDYKGNEIKVIITCKIHGDFEQTPHKHITYKQGCIKCGFIKTSTKLSKTNDTFLEQVKQIHGDKYDLSKVFYKNNNTKVTIGCKIHGYNDVLPNGILTQGACKQCASNKYDNHTFSSKAITVHGSKYEYNKVDYKKGNVSVIITCKIHGDFEQKPNRHLAGKGCQKCKNKTEGILFLHLKNIYPSIIYQYTASWCRGKKLLQFDFCIPEHKIIIELDGLQHFEQVLNWSSPEEQFKKDIFKETCANDNGYSTVRLLQEDVFRNRYDWKIFLKKAIDDIINGKELVNKYISTKNEYAKFLCFNIL